LTPFFWFSRISFRTRQIARWAGWAGGEAGASAGAQVANTTARAASGSSPVPWAARRGRRRVPAEPAAGPRRHASVIENFQEIEFQGFDFKDSMSKIRILEIESLDSNPWKNGSSEFESLKIRILEKAS
jgi:hypothetical protein